MVKVINIDTKTRTIRVENADGDIKTWRTTESGAHFPIKKGESTKEALDKFVEKKRPEATPKTAGQLKKAAAKLESDPAYHYERADRLSEMIKQREKELDSPNLTPTAKKAIERGIGDLQLAISKHWDAAGKLEKAQKKQQPAKKDPNEFIKKAAEHNREYEEAKEKLPKEIGQKADQEIHDLNKKYGAIVESMPQGKEKTDKINEWVEKYHAIQDKVIQQTAKKETKSEDPRKSEAESSDNFHALWEKYVPDEGTADTLLGEMVRAAGRIRYRYYNDGDMYGYGYGKETVNNALSYLSKLAGGRDTEFKKELDRALYQATTAAAHYDEDEYKRQVDRIVDAFANANWDDIKELASIKNETDSLTEYPDDTSYDDDDEDEEW